MLLQYKLLLQYPGLPLGFNEHDVVIFDTGRGLYFKTDMTARGQGVSRQEVEENPAFWEKCQSKYEILSFTDNQGNIKQKKEDGKFYFPWDDEDSLKGSTVDWEILRTTKDIHSVKRLSDGQVFTVDDRVKHPVDTPSGHMKWEIRSMRIDNGDLRMYSGTGFYKEIEDDVSSRSELLFTTEDGVEIYTKDGYYAVDREHFTIVHTSLACRYSGRSPLRIYFSTEQKAKEWVEQNQPKYTKEQIEQALEKSTKTTRLYGLGTIVPEMGRILQDKVFWDELKKN